jgi:hypothetical protein
MSRALPPKVDEDLWSGALLASDTELLLGAARNYLGPVRTPYDKREIVDRLKSFLRRPEVRAAVSLLLDELDARILGSLFLLGPTAEADLRSLFEGELPLFDLGIRLANLQDRLLVFRFESGGRKLIAPNPILADALEDAVLDPAHVFGVGAPAGSGHADGGHADGGHADGVRAEDVSGEMKASGGLEAQAGRAGQAGEGPLTAGDLVAVFSFLFHSPGCLRKGGGLTKKAQERAATLLPESVGGKPERLAAVMRAFEAAGFLGGGGEEGREVDLASFREALEAWGEDAVVWLASVLAFKGMGDAGLGSSTAQAGTAPASTAQAGAVCEGPSRFDLAAAGAAALKAAPRGFVYSRGGLNRWLEIVLRRSRRGREGISPDLRRGFVEALLALGLVSGNDDGLSVRAALGKFEGAAAEPDGPGLVAEGSHAIHVLPEAGLRERLFVGIVARPVSFATAWTFEIDRESARRAFAAGIGAVAAIEGLETFAGRPLPQSLTFSIKAWEEEFRSLRLYRGFILVADDRLRQVVERSRALAPYVAERLAPGVFVLAVSGAEEAADLIRQAGLEAPPETHYGPSAHHKKRGAEAAFAAEAERLDLDEAETPALAVGRGAEAAAAPLAALRQEGPAGLPSRLDPRPRLSLLEAALDAEAVGMNEGAPAGSLSDAAPGPRPASEPRPARGPAELRELAERIGRRLILTPQQLAAAEVRPDRLEATGLDYLGKVRIVERALRGPGDRLEILYRLPGGEPTRALLRPVRLEKTEKGLVLEAEDLGTRGPVRIPLGAASSVRRMRASLFGEDI